MYSLFAIHCRIVWLVNGSEYPMRILFPITLTLLLYACTQQSPQTRTTIADARVDSAVVIDIGEVGDSIGDILVFDQPLLDADMDAVGNNSGFCIRTRVGHSLQCQWTLSLDDGTVQVAGREFDQGTSNLSIIGGTGNYAGVTGEMESTNNKDGTFTQTLRFRK